MIVRRIDAVSLLRRDAVEVTAEGFRLYDALFSRTGIQEYSDGRGGIVREYRPDSEVFSAASLASYELRPLTDGHPPSNVTTGSARALARGAISGARRHEDGRHVAGKLAVWDADLIAKFDAGQVDLSMGYEVTVEPTPGISPDGERYDAIQRAPVINHCAGVVAGRAGTARILDAADLVGAIDLGIAKRLDSISTTSRVVFDLGRWSRRDAADLRTQQTPAKETRTMKILTHVDGKPVEIELADNASPEQIAEAVAKPHADALEAAKKAKDALPPEFLKKKKGAEEEEEDSKKKGDAADFDARLDAATTEIKRESAERADALSVARTVLGLRYDGAGSVATIKLDVIESVLGKPERETITSLPTHDQAGATAYAFRRAVDQYADRADRKHSDSLLDQIQKAHERDPKSDAAEDSITKARREATDRARNPNARKQS